MAMRQTLSVFMLLAALALSCALGCTSPAPGREHTPATFVDPSHTIETSVWSEKALKEENVVMQRHDYSCGPAALATIIRYYWGDDVSEDEFIKAIMVNLTEPERQERVKNGLTMTDLRLAAVRKGYFATIGKRSLAQMVDLKVPVVVSIKTHEHEHFVVYRGVIHDRVFLADPIRGNIRMSFDVFAAQWNNRAILVVAKPHTSPPQAAPLVLEPYDPVVPELEAARRSLFIYR